MERNSAAERDASDRVTAAIEALFHLEGSRRIHQQHCDAAGVSVSRQGWHLLARVVESGSTSPGELAGFLDLDPSVVARLLRQLEDGGLVERRRADHDGRVSALSPTAEGRDAYQRMREVIWRHMRRVLAGWPARDTEELAGLLVRLLDDVRSRPYLPLPQAAGARRS